MTVNEQDSRVVVVHRCFSERGDSILSVFSLEPLHELMFQAGVKGMSERSELIPCIYIHMQEIMSYACSAHKLLIDTIFSRSSARIKLSWLMYRVSKTVYNW